MFGSKTRRLRDDLAWEKSRNRLLRQQLAAMASECDSWKWAAKKVMGPHEDALIERTKQRDAAHRAYLRQLAETENATRHADSLRTRLTRTLRACARYRAELAAQQAVVERQTQQLFDAVGYDPADRKLLTAGEVTS